MLYLPLSRIRNDGEDAKLSLKMLLKGYTIKAAKQLRFDDVTGSITVGKRANYNVYAVNLFEVPEDSFNVIVRQRRV